MTVDNPSRPKRRFLQERLERLHASLEGLGQRLRESLADLIGTQIGDAIRDTLAAALHLKPEPRQPEFSPAHDLGDGPDDFFSDPDREHAGWREPAPAPLPRPEEKRPRWQPLLMGGMQLASAFWQKRPPRPSLRRWLGFGAVAGVATLLAGPVIGGILATVGLTILLTRKASNVRAAGMTSP